MSNQYADLLGDIVDAGEYAAPPAPTPSQSSTVVIMPPDPRQFENSQKYLKLYTQNQIRKAFNALAHNNLNDVQNWLHAVAKDSPAKAVELFIELARFSLPQLKETSVNVTQGTVTRTFTSSADILAELEKQE